MNSPVSWDCRIHQLHLCRCVRPLPIPNECPGYDTKTSDGEAPVLELWEMWSTSLLPLLPGLLRPRVVVPLRVPSMVQIELFNLLLGIVINIKQN